ncbi:hypothetical protein ABB37_00968 [Leptomonas pyrrhocoris]|uniref:RING-type domain-containing protein n=1 Tax=Leptomonas pyrrhocoris TaxID=157538 RepID=A0A0N1J5J0_LEPPY|nr:hypothetical protein ABB37_00968 [Leptomonas pyrrhocoris]KPA86941.1 hypothetical protein ABB37_00968 [Leptomonas pyrrhocoris]|eukprot:XP_015665380.1 hypothetical protein ABB37_00968 [Leptomonas pyrrhocoris]
MPPKGTKRAPAKAAAVTKPADDAVTLPSPDPSTMAPSTAAAGPARKRARTSIEAAANRDEVEVDRSVASVTSETPTVITIDEDDDSRTASETATTNTAAAQSRRAPRRSRQTTLTGDVVDPPEKAVKGGRAKARKEDSAAAAAPDMTLGGELKPSPPVSAAKKTGSKANGASTASSPALDGPAAAPMLEQALLAHVRNALVLYSLKRSQRVIRLTTVTSAAQRTDAMNAYAASIEAAVGAAAVQQPPSSAVGELEDRTAPAHADEADEAVEDSASHDVEVDDAQGFLALPCVQYFIVNECARVARAVREGGGNGYGDDPAQRAMALLGLLLSMLDTPGSFVTLLLLACPSCRSIGIVTDTVSKVIEFLVLSQRVKREDVLRMDQAKACEVLGLLDGCRDDSGVPVEPLRCCPYGEAHVNLQLLLAGRVHLQGSVRNCTLQYSLVPFQMHDFPAIAEAAKQYYRGYEEYTATWERRYNEQRVGGYENSAAQSLWRKPTNPPELQKKTLALLANKADGVTWAEDVFHKIFPDTVVPGQPHLSCGDLQARIRAVYAYTRADVLGRGGFFKVALNTPSSYFRGQAAAGMLVGSELVYFPHLFSLLKVFQHIAEGILHGVGNDDRVPPCLCNSKAASLSPSFLMVEEHLPYVAALRRCREEQYLLVDESKEAAEAVLCNSQVPVDVDAVAEDKEEEKALAKVETDSNDTGGTEQMGSNVSYYAAGSFARFHATLDLVGQMSAEQTMNYVARVTADSAEALPVAAVPRTYIHAALKRHQLEDVQWMWSKETEGYREHVQVPLYCVVPSTTAAQRPVVQRTGMMFYCATTEEVIVERGAATQTAKWSAAGNLIRGGLLCDDVGLGKTLAVLTLCAYDRASRESGAVDDDEDNAMSSPNRFWQATARNTVARTTSIVFNPDVLRWGFGPDTFLAGTAPHTVCPMRLPRTTLVVVPLSIAAQWIEELHKFYPGASYILFHGAKRTQYTAQDLQRADFVLTTYETLSTHLRHETDGLHYWLSRSADVGDDKACAEAASRGWQACRPSHLYAALQAFASSTVWSPLPDAGDSRFLNFNRSRGFVLDVHNTADVEAAVQHQRGRGRTRSGGGRRGRGRSENAGDNHDGVASPPPPPQLNKWVFVFQEPVGLPCFHCPVFSLYVNANGDPTNNAVEYQPAWQALYHRLCIDAPSPVSDSFLDGLWALVKGYSASIQAPPETSSYSMHTGLFDAAVGSSYTESLFALIFRTETRYPMSDHIRRLFVLHVLLPPLWQPLQMYWAEMKPHYAAVASAELTGQMPLRILDLLFHRVVLDESQKCGANSLFHLLLGERRWAVTGTPLNNNKTTALSTALSFLGMSSAAQLLSRTPHHRMYVFNTWLSRHTSNSQFFNRMHFSRTVCTALKRLMARLCVPVYPNEEFQDPSFCLCSLCTQDGAYGAAAGVGATIPLEWRRREEQRQFLCDLPCLPNVLMEIFALTMVRHERSQQVSRELQLPPVRYTTHRVDLSGDEMQLYDRVARAVMQVAARLHRQGVLSSRMGHAMQWAQALCRLCLHPSRVGDAALLRGDIEAHLLRAVRFVGNDSSPSPANLAAAVEEASFVEVTAQEALEWAQMLAANNTKRAHISFTVQIATATNSGRGRSAQKIPEETVAALNDLQADPPLLPLCGVCLDDMVAPTLLSCFHMYCKECVIGVIDASRSFAGNVIAKCPYCRDPKSLLVEKRVITIGHEAAINEEATAQTAPEADDAPSGVLDTDDGEAALIRIGDGSRVCAFVALVAQIWAAEPGDGILVFSKYPAFLQLAHDTIQAAGYAPYIVRGASTLAQRQRVMRALQQPGGALPVPHRILFVTSRSANAGLNLTFANHVIFLEPNLNPAMEQQAVGRVHRFGQLKQVYVHHLYAPRTIEEVIYVRSVRLREQATQQPVARPPAAMAADAVNANEVQRDTQFGRIAPAEISLLLEYPVPPQRA